MHLLVSFAVPMSEAGRQALRSLALPNLRSLWPALDATLRDVDDEMSLSPPHERALARALGLPAVDGLVPTAAIEAAWAGIDTGARPWARLTPAHWQLGAERVTLADPAALALDEAQSRALLEAVRGLFESEGFELHYGAPTAWFASHPSLAELPSASLDRAVGRNVDAWLGAEPRARLLRRLQNEAQMLLHAHPLNAEREARGQWPVNSFWLSGTGAAPPAPWPSGIVVDHSLRTPALGEDWAAWSRAWCALDADRLAQAAARTRRREPFTLTLCGERGALTLAARPRGLLQRLAGFGQRPDPLRALEGL